MKEEGVLAVGIRAYCDAPFKVAEEVHPVLDMAPVNENLYSP